VGASGTATASRQMELVQWCPRYMVGVNRSRSRLQQHLSSKELELAKYGRAEAKVHRIRKAIAARSLERADICTD